jgi:hypothetical protein
MTARFLIALAGVSLVAQFLQARAEAPKPSWPAAAPPPPAAQWTPPQTEGDRPQPATPPDKVTYSPALQEALAQLRLCPGDSYLQFVALQLARRENCLAQVADELEVAIGPYRAAAVDLFSIFTGALAVQESLQLDTMRGPRPAPAAVVAAYMAAAPEEAPPPKAETADAPPAAEVVVPEPAPMPAEEEPGAEPAADKPQAEATTAPADHDGPCAPAQAERKIVPLAELEGPAVKSHPWKKMLAGRKPEIEPLACMVPSDFYYIHFRSLSSLLDLAELVDLGTTHFGNQAWCEAFSQCTGERIQKQLLLTTGNRELLELLVKDIALVGSDPFAREGSDVTVLIRFNRRRCRLANSIATAAKERPDAHRSHGTCLGVPFEHLETPDREICIYVAYPQENLQVRSNSLAALERVLAAIKGRDAEGHRVHRLGDSAEFAYIRTLYPCGAEEEDGLMYLSDTFIRRLVGPQLKLTERRRLLCYNHLRLIGNAAMLYRSEHGRPPESLDELYAARCLPGPFGEPLAEGDHRLERLLADLHSDDTAVQERAAIELAQLDGPVGPDVHQAIGEILTPASGGPLFDLPCRCPDGGTYYLSADGMSGVCTCHGRAHCLTPNLEIPLDEVSGGEAAEYRAFCKDYEQYWRSYFDPIAIRVQVTPERYRLETIVLPLIDNSIYTGLAAVFGGQPEDLDALPVPGRNIFSVNFRLNKEAMFKQLEEKASKDAADSDSDAGDNTEQGGDRGLLAADSAVSAYILDLLKQLHFEESDLKKAGIDDLNVLQFLRDGLGNQVGFHIYDAPARFDFNLANAFGLLPRIPFNDASSDRANILAAIAFEVLPLIGQGAAVNGPVYFAIPVQDARVVDEFGVKLERLFALLARRCDAVYGDLWGVDFYRVPFQNEPGKDMRVVTVRLGPVRLRWYYARIGRGLYIASEPCVLHDLLALQAEEACGEPAHALVKIRACNWKHELTYNRRGWAENERQACIHNLGPLSSVARAVTASLGLIGEDELAGLAERIVEEADRLHQVHFACPAGGHYVLSADGQHMTCSVHGSALEPHQPPASTADSPLGKRLEQFGGLTATLTFMEEGLRAVVVVERK